MLYVIGLGLGDERDISLRGLDIIKTKCSRVLLEAYTSLLPGVDKERLEELYGKDVEIAYREKVEDGIGEVIDEAKTKDVAFLVVGDPFSATTHSDLQSELIVVVAFRAIAPRHRIDCPHRGSLTRNSAPVRPRDRDGR